MTLCFRSLPSKPPLRLRPKDSPSKTGSRPASVFCSVLRGSFPSPLRRCWLPRFHRAVFIHLSTLFSSVCIANTSTCTIAVGRLPVSYSHDTRQRYRPSLIIVASRSYRNPPASYTVLLTETVPLFENLFFIHHIW